MKDTYAAFEKAAEEARGWLQAEIAGLRTGRVTPDLVTQVPVEHYGARTPLQGLANVSSADARTLVIAPWDPSAVPAIEKALSAAQLGAQPAVDGEVVRLSFPSLTEEAREQTVKTLHGKAEEARVRLRQARDDALAGLQQEKKKGDITEDHFYQGKKRLDERIDAANAALAEIVAGKEREVVSL